MKQFKKSLFLFVIILLTITFIVDAQNIKNSSLGFDFTKNISTIKVLQKGTTNNLQTIQSNSLEVPFKNIEPFLAVGIHIEFLNVSKESKIFICSSSNGIDWGKWKSVNFIKEESSKIIGRLLFFDRASKFVQYKIITNELNDNLVKEIKKVSLHFISPGKTTDKQIQKNFSSINKRSTLQTQLNKVTSFPRPSYINRTGWNCPHPENTTSRTLTNVKHVVIHHSAANSVSSDYAAVVRSYWNYHVYNNGWDDIGYNWLVDPNGVLYKGRAWYSSAQENVKGAHNSGKNANTVGVCFIGDYHTTNQPSTAGLNMIEDITAFLCDKYGIDPLGQTYINASLGTKDNIEGHRGSGGGTACPGDNLYAKLGVIRTNVNNKINGTTSPTNIKALDVRTTQHTFVIDDNVNNDLDQTSAYTIEFWINASSQSQYDRILYSPSFQFFTLNPSGTEDYRLRYAVGDFSYTFALDFYTWHHILVSYDGTWSRIYLDGIKLAAAQTLQHSAIDYISIGAKWNGSAFSNYGNFGLEEVRFSNIARHTGTSFSVSYESAPYTSDDNTIFLFHFDDSATPPINSSSKTFTISNSSIDTEDYKDWDDVSFTNYSLPVELINFNVTSNNDKIILTWETATEIENYGFSIERKLEKIYNKWKEITFINGAGNSNYPKQYSFVDEEKLIGKINYRLKQIDFDGRFNYSNVKTILSDQPFKTELFTNYPNPFNPTTKISYSLSKTTNVKVTVYNALGKQVSKLVDGIQNAGFYNVLFDASDLSSGIYLYRIETPNYSKTLKMLLLK